MLPGCPKVGCIAAEHPRTAVGEAEQRKKLGKYGDKTQLALEND